MAQLCSAASGALQASVTAAAMVLFALPTSTSLSTTPTSVRSTITTGITFLPPSITSTVGAGPTHAVSESSQPSSGLPTPQIVGIVIGVFAVLVAILVIIPFYVRKGQ